MHNHWIVEVLGDIEAFAVANSLDSLVPLISKAYEVASRDLKTTVPIPLIDYRSRQPPLARLKLAEIKVQEPVAAIDFELAKTLRSQGCDFLQPCKVPFGG